MPIKPEQYVAIPAVKVPDAIKFAYSRSQARGLGILRYEAGDLADEVVDLILKSGGTGHSNMPGIINLDYVKGRCVKFVLRQHPTDETVWLTNPSWYDHDYADLVDLLTSIGIADAEQRIADANAAIQRANEAEDAA